MPSCPNTRKSRDLNDFLWLLADGYGPLEATPSFTVSEPGWTARSNQELTSVAEDFAPGRRRSAPDIIKPAAREYPDFDNTITELFR
ncbi:hypothetical protein GCM10010270_79130 [Streptomyces violaceus]|nr:hypothetical protein GCM10010270_79130 [Streptomyces janthinus]